MKQTQISEIL